MSSGAAPVSGASPKPIGPRPLGEKDRDQLWGREDDLDVLLSLVRNSQVVILTADSGIGKTSLIRAGLLEAMRAEGFLTDRLVSWSPVRGRHRSADDWMEPLCRALNAVTGKDRRPDESPQQYLEEVDSLFGGRVVLVFDQVEEMFRFDRTVGENLLDAVIGSLTADWPFSFRFVLSLRSEHRDAVARLEHSVDPRFCTNYRLQPLAEGCLEGIIERFPRGAASFSRSATDAIIGMWTDATTNSGDVLPVQQHVGLLDFRALLWSLFERVTSDAVPRRMDSGSISQGEVLGAARSLIGVTGSGQLTHEEAQQLVASALTIYVERQLMAMREDASSGSYDDRLEAWIMASRVVPHLSSGSFKVIRRSPDLAALALPRLADVLPVSHDGRDVVRAVVGALEGGVEPDGIPSAEDVEKLVLDGFPATGSVPSEGDNSAAGRLYGASPALVVASLIVAYERSLKWLEAAGVLRVGPAPGGARSVSLAHDGFGPALMGWAEDVQTDPVVPIHSLIAITGRQVLQAGTSRTVDAMPQEATKTPTLAARRGDTAIRRAVWQGCYVSGYLQDVEFVECDFRGSIFSDVQFDGVTFYDCVMWGVLFREASILGGGVTISSSSSSFLTEMRTLTFGAGVALSGAGLRLVGQHGYGLFLNGPVGGPILLDDCHIEHLTFRGARVSPGEGLTGVGPVQLNRGTRLTHVVLGEGLTALDLADGAAEYVSNPTRVRVTGSGLEERPSPRHGR